jgi:hypothetical protein
MRNTGVGMTVNRKIEICKLLSLLALPCAAAVFLRFAPGWAERFYPRCFLYAAMGLYCPGCGTLRALRALGGLDFRAAFACNPFLFLIAAPTAVYMGAIFSLRAATGKWVPSRLSSGKAALPVSIIIIAIFAARNIFHV